MQEKGDSVRKLLLQACKIWMKGQQIQLTTKNNNTLIPTSFGFLNMMQAHAGAELWDIKDEMIITYPGLNAYSRLLAIGL